MCIRDSSYLCDRFTVNTATSQIGFIDIIVMPVFDLLHQFIPGIEAMCNNLKHNKILWKERVAEFEEKLKAVQAQREGNLSKIADSPSKLMIRQGMERRIYLE
eukprot:TRINITY_DN8209_c0_g1_i10.p2 TRINITY_DN8209_c0_g1~~TRINITY_DN8209_c0_g1_i10.p2  ORF type:complete len:103 (-),score=9.11 TRINITY_DN8209_c0_g1_i10:180-488(-)